MKSVKHHLDAIRITFSLLLKGECLYFFIPGLTLTAIYYFFLFRSNSAAEIINLETGISMVDSVTSYVEKGISSVFYIFNFILEQLYIFAVLTLLAPFNTYFAEKLDHRLTGRTYPFSLAAFVNDLFRMVLVVLLALFLEFAFSLIYWMLSWVFGLGVVDPLMYHLIAAFFFGFSFYDYALERHRKNVGNSLFYAFEHPLSMVLTGSIFLVIYKIPFLGIPLSVTLALMISTIVYLYNEKIRFQNTDRKNE